MPDINTYIEKIREKLDVKITASYSANHENLILIHHTKEGLEVRSHTMNEAEALIVLENSLNKHKRKVKRLNVDISLYLHNQLKDLCLQKEINMKDAVEDMIRNYLKD